MFKVGDRIVLINNDLTDKTYYSDLELNKTYIVVKDLRNFPTDGWIRIEGTTVLYDSKRFISVVDYRKLKLKKICSRLETR